MSDTKEMGGSPVATREVSNGSAEKKSKKKGCMRHCKKFWWVYLIVFILAAVLIICLIIFVAVPKIAQNKINEAKLELTNVEILETTSDTYEMTIDSIIRSDGKVHAKISPFEGVMYLEDKPGHTPFATLDFPQTSSDKYQEVNVTQDVKISDMDAFTDFNIWFHNNDTLRVTVEGKTKVKPNGLSRKYDVDFKKTVEIKGLNVFEGTKVTEGEIKRLDRNETGPNFIGKTDIPNQSVFTLDIGNITFNNYIEGNHVGYLYIDNFILKPGSNVVDITAEIDQARVLEYLTSDKYCKTGIIPMELLGENITNHGQDISYFAAALASKKQIVEMDIGKFIKESPDYGLDLTC